jgi:HAD superfamily hydrolase (TIGR01509 family)
MPLRAVLFDFGHTLVDFRRTEEALMEAYTQIRARIEAVGYMEMPEILDLIERVAGGIDQVVAASYEERRLEELDIVTVFRESLEAIGFTLPADVIDAIVAMDHSAYTNSMAVRPETLEALERLAGAGYVMGLVSNIALLPHLMRADLETFGLARYVSAAAFSSEVGVRKPHPAIFRTVLDELAVGPSEAVFVGDRLADDVAGASDLGMRTVLTHEFRREEPGEIRPDAVIDTLAQLPELLEGWRTEADSAGEA